MTCTGCGSTIVSCDNCQRIYSDDELLAELERRSLAVQVGWLTERGALMNMQEALHPYVDTPNCQRIYTISLDQNSQKE